MLRVRDDDAGAFAELVSRYELPMVRLMRSIGPRPSDAEDLTQETFLRLYRARHRYQPGAKFSTYLYTIAGNVARNAKRSSRRRHEVNEADSPVMSTSGSMLPITQTKADVSGNMPIRQIERAERAEMVRHAIAALGERQRMALMLSRFEHLNYVEIAEAMGITTKAVKSLLSRARVSVGESLAAYVDPDDDENLSVAPEDRP